MARTTDTVPENRQGRPSSSIDELVEWFFDLPLEARMGVFRTIAPKLIASLPDPAERERARRELEEALEEEDGRSPAGEPADTETPRVH
jgi:hypothetical protein